MVSLVPAHVACAGLVGVDMLARALRVRLVVSRLGGPLSLGDAVRLNLLGDAAAEVTPFRMAGEPARLGALLRAGVPTRSALMAVGAEFALTYAVVVLLVTAASWTTLPAWWSSIGPALYRAAVHVPVWGVALLALAITLSFPLVSRLRRVTTTLPRPAGLRSSLQALAGIGSRGVVAVLALTAVNMSARVGILWMLASTLPASPAAGSVLVGSFLLLFGQAFSPTPSGLGVVEMGIMGGAAGPFGGHAVSILLYWRAYTAILPILLAVAFALPRFGAAPVMAMLGFRRGAKPLAETAQASCLNAAE